MAPFQITTSLLGVGLAALIVLLLRRDDLYVRHALFWMAMAIAAAGLGMWPRILDGLGLLVGVRYSPALALLCAVMVLFVKALLADVANTKLETDVRHLQQSVALLEAELALIRQQAAAQAGAGAVSRVAARSTGAGV